MRVYGWTLGAIALAAAVPALALQDQARTPASPAVKGELIVYEMTNFNGAGVSVTRRRPTMRTHWNIRSVAVHPGDRWQLCARPRFQEPCIILDRSVPDATMIGVDGQIGSIRNAAEIEGEGD